MSQGLFQGRTGLVARAGASIDKVLSHGVAARTEDGLGQQAREN